MYCTIAVLFPRWDPVNAAEWEGVNVSLKEIYAYTHIQWRATHTHTCPHTQQWWQQQTLCLKRAQGSGRHSSLCSDGCAESHHSLHELISCQALITPTFHSEIRLQICSNDISGQIVFIAFISISITACLWFVSEFITIILYSLLMPMR